MTLANRFPQAFEFPRHTAAPAEAHAEVAYRNYQRILVLLDGSRPAERAIHTAIEMAQVNDAEIVLICQNKPGNTAYVEAKSRNLCQQRINARGYVFNQASAGLPNWLLQAEQADAIVMTQKPVGWVGRLLGGDAAAQLARRTQADVITVQI